MNGRLLAANQIQVSSTGDHDFHFAATDDMEAEIQINVFFLKENGVAAFDSLQLEFAQLKNFVSNPKGWQVYFSNFFKSCT